MTVTTLYIDQEPRQVDSAQNLLHSLLSLDYDVPYFCWHPALGSVGACRQCAIKQFRDEHDQAGKLIMACMTPPTEGMRISIADPEAVAFRAAVIQGLMQNHPHDCPVCDEGGECHLQDMTVMTGHSTRKYAFTKRTFRNQYLGPLVNHEMNRCIQCQRCVRYYRDYAGGHDLNAFRLRDTVYFGRFEDGVLENEFSGNLVEICPTGVFTDATLKRHYTRKWDLQMAPSVCVHCAAGCNVSLGERYGTLRRVVNRYHHEVNGYFLCDRGRFGYEFVHSKQRIGQSSLDGEPISVTGASAQLETIVQDGRPIGIGSPRGSLESNFALRQLVGPDHFYAGVAASEWAAETAALEALRNGPARSPSLEEIEHCDAVFILGEDVTSVLPLMALRLRQSVRQQPLRKAGQAKIPLWLDAPVRELLQDEKGPLFVAAPFATKLDDVAARVFRAAPEGIAELGFAVAHAIDPAAPAASHLTNDTAILADEIALALRSASSPLVVSGFSCGSTAVVQAAAQVAGALYRTGNQAKLAYCFPECNSAGLALMAPKPITAAFEALRQGGADTVIVLENDLYRRAAADEVTAFLDQARHVVVLDHVNSPTTKHAELVLAVGTFAETDGTLVNYEGRAQRFYKVVAPPDELQASWHWLGGGLIPNASRNGHKWQVVADVVAAIAAELPVFAPAGQLLPPRDKVGKVAREPNRYSGRTSMLANISIHEPKPPDDPDSPLAFSMEAGPQPPPPALTPFYWAPGWNSVQSVNKFQTEVGGALRGGDPGVRLIECRSDGPWFYSEPPQPVRADEERWLVVPQHHLFGSEELSRLAPAIASLVPRPSIVLNLQDAARLDRAAGQLVELTIENTVCELAVALSPDVPPGVAIVPAGFPPLSHLFHPVPAKLRAVETAAVGVLR